MPLAGSPALRSYRISPLRRSLLWWLLGPFVLLGLGILLFAAEDKRGAGLVIMLLMAPWLLWWHWYTGRLRLEVSPEGVTHRHGRLLLHAPWSQIDRVRLHPAREGFVMREPLQGLAADRLAAIRGMWLIGVPYYDQEQQQLMAEHRFLPIDPFAYLLRNGRLLADFDQFAPALGKAARAEVNEMAQLKRLPKPPPTAEEQMKWLRVFLLIFAMAGLGIWVAVSPNSHAATVFEWIMAFLVAICLPLWSLVSAWSSWNAFRAGLKTLGVLYALFVLVKISFGLLIWIDLIKGR